MHTYIHAHTHVPSIKHTLVHEPINSTDKRTHLTKYWMQVGNVEVGATSAEISSLIEEEEVEKKWKEIVKEDSRKALTSLEKVGTAWEDAQSLEVPEHLQKVLHQLKG